VQPGSADGNDSSGLNNNADELEAGGQDNSDRIKASIYESLKNDLLRNEKASSGARAGDLPINRIHSLNSRPNNKINNKKGGATSPHSGESMGKLGDLEAGPTQQKHNHLIAAQNALPGQQQQQRQQPQAMSPSHHQQPPPGARDIMRLVNSSLSSPMSLGQTSVTITRAPKGGGAVVLSGGQPATVLPASFLSERPSPPPPQNAASLTLTPSGGGGGSQAPPYLHSATLILSQPAAGQQRGLLVSGQQTPPHAARSSPSAAIFSQPATSTHGLHQSSTLSVAYTGPLLTQQQPRTTSSSLVVSPLLNQPKQLGGHVMFSAAASDAVVPRTPVSDCGAVNLSMARRQGDGESDTVDSGNSVTVSVASTVSVEGGRSARSCKGKRYQEFLEDGRINAPGSRKRRSHRSGEESEEEAAVNLSLGSHGGQGEDNTSHHQYHHQHRNNASAALNLATTNQHHPPSHEDALCQNHWKKKLRTAASGGKAPSASAAAGDDHHRGGGKRGSAAGFQSPRGLPSSCGNNLAFDGR
jgi:hypothetical protein